MFIDNSCGKKKLKGSPKKLAGFWGYILRNEAASNQKQLSYESQNIRIKM